MARFRKPARIVMWTPRKGSEKQHYIFYTDYTVQPPKAKRVLCKSLGAFTLAERRELLRSMRMQEKQEFGQRAFTGVQYHFSRPLTAALKDYLAHIEQRVKARGSNPRSRVGLAKASGERIEITIEAFMAWLRHTGRGLMPCGDLDSGTLRLFINDYATEETLIGERKTQRSAETINICARNLKTALKWVDELRPRHFRDFADFASGLKCLRVDAPQPRAYTPAELQAFAEECTKHRGELLRLFLVLALTGCRPHEAMQLTWDGVDLEQGVVEIYSQKTGRTRWVPLTGSSDGEISQGLLDAMKSWKQEGGERVLYFNKFPREGWRNAAKRAGLDIRPKDVRSNFTSYAAVLGVPPAVCAMWQGHGASVAERHYRAQLRNWTKGARSFEEAMGLESFFKK